MKTAEGELLQHVLQLERIIKSPNKMSKYGMNKDMCKGAMCKLNCMDSPGCGSGMKKGGLYMGDMGEKNKYCQEKFGKNYSECSPSQKAQCDKHCGDMKKGDYMFKVSMDEKNKYCQKHFGCNYSECSPSQKAQCDRNCGKDVKKGNYMVKVSMDEKNKYCQKHFGCNYSECTPKQKAQCNENCGKDVKKGDDDMYEDTTGGPIEANEMKEMARTSKRNRYCQKHFGKNYSECSPSQKAQCDGEVKKGNYMMNEELENPKLADRDKDGKLSSWEKTVGKKIEQSKKGKETGDYKSDRGNKKIPFKEETKKPVKKEDFTSRFIAQKTGADLVKYEQESISDNGVPQFVDHYGIRAVNYQTNGRIPYFEQNAQSVNAISEKAKMPAFAKTGYDAKGSSLHMHLTNGGDRADGNWNIAPIEERLTELKKGATNPGLVDEIANLMESIANRL